MQVFQKEGWEKSLKAYLVGTGKSAYQAEESSLKQKKNFALFDFMTGVVSNLDNNSTRSNNQQNIVKI